MSAYVIANYTVNNAAVYAEYPKRAAETVAQYGGTSIVVAHDPLVLEGVPRSIVVVVRFESVQAAQKWYTSPEYQSVAHYRKDSSEGWITICPEFDFTMMFKK
jgi:uncharacterized protein (DUF1330 family)